MTYRRIQATPLPFLGLGLLIAVVVLAAAALSGCSAYGHQPEDLPAPIDNIMRADGGPGPVYGGDGCIPGTCCNPSSCNPACADGYVCMTGKCINVLQVCGAK